MTEQIQPKAVFHFFEELSQIPHGSGDTKKISDYCVKFAKERNLSYVQDEVNNIIIRKPGTAGYETSAPVILQGHLDMVCVKRPGSAHDFTKDPLELFVEDGYLKARDTSLGGDDGIAVAMALALLDSTDIPHPPMEALFTVDEETGMDGAMALDFSQLTGRKLINIDSEEEGVLTTGCAGGFHYETILPVRRENRTGEVVHIKIHGLLGGHSGAEIHKQRGNAHKLMGRLLQAIESELELPVYIERIDGGTKDNVIAVESEALLLTLPGGGAKIAAKTKEMRTVWESEFMGEEPGLAVDAETEGTEERRVMDADSTRRVTGYLVVCPDGVRGMSRSIQGLVETSLNMGVIETKEEAIYVTTLARSSVESRKRELEQVLAVCAAFAGGNGENKSEYPAWQYRADSPLRMVMESVYQELYGRRPLVSAMHGGLECGLFMGKCPDLDCVSFGPDLLDIHSFDERLDIASVGRTWEYLKAVLKRLQ